MLRGLCPECGAGPIFASTWRMNPTCPVCGTKFERGPGYFTGAMYFSYALGIPIIALGTLVVWLIARWPLHWAVLVVWAAFLPLVPFVFRLSRVMFIHFDRYFDPDDPPGDPLRPPRDGGRGPLRWAGHRSILDPIPRTPRPPSPPAPPTSSEPTTAPEPWWAAPGLRTFLPPAPAKERRP